LEVWLVQRDTSMVPTTFLWQLRVEALLVALIGLVCLASHRQK
jgi:hypothetical protein